MIRLFNGYAAKSWIGEAGGVFEPETRSWSVTPEQLADLEGKRSRRYSAAFCRAWDQVRVERLEPTAPTDRARAHNDLYNEGGEGYVPTLGEDK